MADNILKGIIEIEAKGVGTSLNQVNTAIAKTETGFKKLAPASNQATLALSNLGRVAQDAPYGFIGIANNLNPLLESFQRLKATTGTTGGALRALAGSLTGPAGVGIALSVVSSLLVVFGDKIFGASKKSKQLEDDYKSLAATLAGDVVKLTSLVAVITNVNTSQEDRRKGLAAINSEYGDYIKNLGLEEVSLGNISKAYDKIIDSLLRQAVVKGLQKEIEKEVAKAAESILKLGAAPPKLGKGGLDAEFANRKKQEEEQKKVTEQRLDSLNKEKIAYNSLESKVARANKVIKDGFIAQTNQEKAVVATVNQLDNYDDKLKLIKDNLLKSLAPIYDKLSNFSFNDLDIKPTIKKGAAEDVIAKAQRIFSEVKDIITLDLNIRADDSKGEQKAKAQAFLDDYFKGNYNIKLKAAPILDSAPPPEVKEAGSTFGEYFYSEFKNYVENVGPASNPIDLEAAIKLDKQKTDIGAIFGLGKKNQGLTDVQSDLVTTAQILTGIVVPAFEGLFDSLISGGNVIQNFFQSLAKGIGQMIAKLAGMAALSGILSLIFPGGIGGVKGFGNIFKNLLGFRAAGGPVGSGGSYIVGERGPELFTPNVNGSIIPNSRMGSYGGGSLGGQVQFVISGNNLIGVLSSAGRNQRRLV